MSIVISLTTPESHRHRALSVHDVRADCGRFHAHKMILTTMSRSRGWHLSVEFYNTLNTTR
jgi:hypothetical protein